MDTIGLRTINIRKRRGGDKIPIYYVRTEERPYNYVTSPSQFSKIRTLYEDYSKVVDAQRWTLSGWIPAGRKQFEYRGKKKR